MVDYERGLGDLGFRGTKGGAWPAARAWGSPNSAARQTLGPAATWWRPAARARV